jgi:non-heme chloroperoxidase
MMEASECIAAPRRLRDAVRLADGTRLNYCEAGSGIPLVAVHGWSQTGAMFEPLLSGLAAHARIVAPDLRGHGRSDRPDHGYSVTQMAFDLASFLEQLNIERPVLIGHSMGCAVVWAFIDLFGCDRVAGQILVDQAPTMLDEIGDRSADRRGLGRLFTAASLRKAVAALRSPFVSMQYVDTMFTRSAPPGMREWVRAENRLLPRRYAAELLFDAATRDWRDAIRRMKVPTLAIACEAGTYPVESMRWICEHIDGARLLCFREQEGGSHLVFMENPDGVCAGVREFLQGLRT